MTPLQAFCGLLMVHWLADFVCQTHWQASNKSKRFDALARHISSYTAVLAVCSFWLFGVTYNTFYFAALNGTLHLATDFVTSRWSAHFYAKQDWHNFFVVIGLDQLIHQLTLAVTMWWLLT